MYVNVYGYMNADVWFVDMVGDVNVNVDFVC